MARAARVGGGTMRRLQIWGGGGGDFGDFEKLGFLENKFYREDLMGGLMHLPSIRRKRRTEGEDRTVGEGVSQ